MKVVQSVSKLLKRGPFKKKGRRAAGNSKDDSKDDSKESTSKESDSDSSAVEPTTRCTSLENDAAKTWMTVAEIQGVNASLAKGTPSTGSKAVDPTLEKTRIKVVKEFIERVNAHDLTSAADLVTDDNHWHFYNVAKELDAEMPWECWVGEMERVNQSFPDFRFSNETAVYTCGDVVVLQGFRAGGTHTGAPYAFGPCEPIEAKGTAVLNDPEEAYFFFREGEEVFARVIICPLEGSEMTGPAGFYTQLGGFPLL